MKHSIDSTVSVMPPPVELRAQGFVMVIALVLTLILGLGGLAAMQSTLFSQKIVHNKQNQSAAEHLAHNVNTIALRDSIIISEALRQADTTNAQNWPTQSLSFPDISGTASVEVKALKLPLLGSSLKALNQYVVTANSDVEAHGVKRRLSIGHIEIAPSNQ